MLRAVCCSCGCIRSSFEGLEQEGYRRAARGGAPQLVDNSYRLAIPALQRALQLLLSRTGCLAAGRALATAGSSSYRQGYRARHGPQGAGRYRLGPGRATAHRGGYSDGKIHLHHRLSRRARLAGEINPAEAGLLF